jgi:predicted RNA-binding Zn-ribbon protein involved in translation (DUF1610 family)
MMATSDVHGYSVCPACGTDLLVPERENLGFTCEGCGVHLVRRGRRIHLVWDHCDMADQAPHARPHLYEEERPIQVR